MKIEPLVIEFPEEFLKAYQKDGCTCPVCGRKFASDVILRKNHMHHHSIIEYLEDNGLLKELEEGNPPFMGPVKGEVKNPMEKQGQNLPIYE